VTPKRKLITGIILLTTLLAGAFVWSLVAGPKGARVPLGELFSDANSGMLKLRVARALLGMFVGAGLAVAGLIFQAVLRNPLADPYILGVSSGAGLGAACAILGGPVALLGTWTIPGLAFVGGVITIFLVYMLARVGKTVPVYSLLLSGVIVNSMASGLLLFLAHTSIAKAKDFQGVLWWAFGDLNIFDSVQLSIAGGAILAGIAVAVLFARDMNTLSLGEEPAAHLGVRVERTKTLLFIVASLMTGAAVAVSGMIGFVGLIVPHAVRLVVGPDNKVLVPLSALAGAVFLVIADIVARSMFGARALPVGILTAFLGGPFFIYLLRTRRGRMGR
jgi:cobalamin transport system permease protein